MTVAIWLIDLNMEWLATSMFSHQFVGQLLDVYECMDEEHISYIGGGVQYMNDLHHRKAGPHLFWVHEKPHKHANFIKLFLLSSNVDKYNVAMG